MKRLLKIIIIISCFIILLFSISLYNTRAHKNWKSNPPGDSLFVDTGDSKLYTRLTGSGSETVVIETDSTSSSAEWEVITGMLSKKYRVLVYDRAGYGFSGKSNLQRNIDNIQKDFEKVLDFHGIKRFTGIGHSNGSLFIQCYAAENPHRVKGLVLVEPTGRDYGRLKKEMKRVFYSNMFDRRGKLKMAKAISGIGIIRLLNAVPYSNIPESLRKNVMNHYSSPTVYDTGLDEIKYGLKTASRKLKKTKISNLPVIVLRHNPKLYRDELLTYYLSWDQAEDIEKLLYSIHKTESKFYRNGKIISSKKSPGDLHITDPESIVNAVKLLVKGK